MALPNGAGGYQVGDGNLNEINLSTNQVTSLTGDATITAAQISGGIIACNKGSDAGLTVTTCTGTELDTGVPSAKVGSSFELTITNNNNSGASSTVTFAGGTGVTLVGSGTVARYGGSTYKFVRTGTGTWSAYLK